MKKFIKSLELRISDLLLLVGFIAFAMFLIFGQLFMQFQDPNQVSFPLWAAIPCFVIMIGCWSYYLYYELYVRKVSFNPYIAITFVILLMINIIAIVIQPSHSSEVVNIRWSPTDPSIVNTKETVLLSVSDMHKFIFISELTGAGMFIYIAMFVFSKRITNISFIEYLGYALFILIGVICIYSYIVEFDSYKHIFMFFLRIDKEHTFSEISNIYAVQSFVIHKNAFGMILMLGIVFCFINQSIRQRKWYYPLAVFFFIQMIFTFCKTGLLITAVIGFIYLVYRLIVTYKDHQKRNKITFIVLGVLVGLGIIFVGVPYVTKGKIFGKVYQLIESFSGNSLTLTTRSYIWDNCYQLLRNGWWLIGRGFGSICLQLMPMNMVSHGEKVFPTHSAFLNMLCSGGIITFLAYLGFLVYIGYVIYKSYKKSPEFTFAVGLGVLCFFLYSFIETIHYLMYIFLFPIFVIYFSNAKQKEELPQVETQKE